MKTSLRSIPGERFQKVDPAKPCWREEMLPLNPPKNRSQKEELASLEPDDGEDL